MTNKPSRPRERASARKKLTINDIAFDMSGPTPVALERLYTWVVWQYPRLRSISLPANKGQAGADGADPGLPTSPNVFTGHSGAVRPGDAVHGWYPAVIDTAANQALIFANIPESFPTPEAAAKHLDQLPE